MIWLNADLAPVLILHIQFFMMVSVAPAGLVKSFHVTSLEILFSCIN